MTVEKKDLIIIVGPHRSGTSLISKLITCYGYSLSENLIPGNEYNKRGYFEDRDIVNFNDYLLSILNSSWNKNQFIDDHTYNNILEKEFIDKGKELILNKFLHKKKLIIKDPRISILIKFWKKVLSELDIKSKFICTLRNPIEVSLSMMRRDLTSISYGISIWAIYLMEIMKELNYQDALIIDLERFLQNPKAIITKINKFLLVEADKVQLNDYFNKFYSKDFLTNLSDNELHENQIFFHENFKKIHICLKKLHNSNDKIAFDNVKEEVNVIRRDFINNKSFNFLDKEFDSITRNQSITDGLYKEKIRQFEKEKEKSLSSIQSTQKALENERLKMIEQQKISEKAFSVEKQKLQKSITATEEALSFERKKLKNTAREIQNENNLLKKKNAEIEEQRRETVEQREEQLRVTDENRKEIHQARLELTEELIKNKQYTADLLTINKNLELNISILNEQKSKNFKFQLIEIAKTKIKKWLKKLKLYQVYHLIRYRKFDPYNQLNKSLKKFKVLNDDFAENLKNFTNVQGKILISIIIPVYGKWEYTTSCLSSVYKLNTKFPFEVIIMDDCSPSSVPEKIKNFADDNKFNLKYLRNEENLGFIGNCNKGSDFAKGEYLIFLNNDTYVSPEWLDTLISTFLEDENVGVAGSKIIYSDIKLQEAGGIIWNDGTGMNFGKGKDPKHPKYNFKREVDYVSGCSFAIKKSLFDETGKFDTDLKVAYYEDVSKCYEVREKGYKTIYQPKSVLIHHEGVTNGRDENEGIKRYQIINKEIFHRKHLKNLDLKKNQYNKLKEQRNSLFSNEIFHRERIIIIDNCIPTPDQDEGSLYMWNLINFLKEEGNLVKFIPTEELYETRTHYFDKLRQIGVECATLPFYSSVDEYLEENEEFFTLAIVTRVNNYENYAKSVKKYNKNARIIFNTIDLHHLREMRQANLEDNQKLLHKAQATKKTEINCIKDSNTTIVVSSKEKDYLLSQDKKTDNIKVLPLLRDTIQFKENLFNKRKNSIFFIGNFNHAPNVDGIEYFVNEIFPYLSNRLIEEHNIQLSLEIIGSNLPQSTERKILESNQDIKYHGYVKDLNLCLSYAKLTIAPLRYGAGLKGKIITSLENGVPVIGSEIAFEDIDIKQISDQINFIVDKKEDYYSSVFELLTNKREWEKISSKSIDFVNKKYSIDSNKEIIKEIIYQ